MKKPNQHSTLCWMTLLAMGLMLSLGTGHALGQRALGMDSDFHCCSVNFVTAANNGIQFACIKATALDEGFSNSVFASRMSAAHSAGVYTIPYNRCNPSTYMPKTEAAFFWSWAAGSISAGGYNLSPALDVEDGLTGSYIGDNGGAISLSGWCNEWYNDVSNYAAAAGIHFQQITYINVGLMCDLGTGLNGYLWLANPCCSNNPTTGDPYGCGGCSSSRAWDGCEPTGAAVWSIWQYAWDELIPGPTEHVDLNAYNGTLTQMVATLGATLPPVSTTTTLNFPTNSNYGQSVVFRATVSPAPSNGTVQFYDTGVALGGPLDASSGTASYFTSLLPPGTHAITAFFSGSAGYLASSATNAPPLQINPATANVTAIPQSKPYGTVLTFASGSTQFTSSGLQNGDTIATVTLAISGNGGASNAPVGTYTITPSQATGGTFNPTNYNFNYNPGTLTVTLPSNTIPVTIVGVNEPSSGIVQLNFAGTPGYVYLIEAATNLVPPINWTILSTNPADTNGQFNFTDPTASNFTERFYRTAAQ